MLERFLHRYPIHCAMHGALEIKIFGKWLVIHPTTRPWNTKCSWYIYWSKDATPSEAVWGIGPGFEP